MAPIPSRCAILSAIATATLFADTSANIYRYPTDGQTPVGMQAGGPAGAFALSGFERVNLYSGKLDLALPLLEVGGRGEARYTMTLRIANPWRAQTHIRCLGSGCQPDSYDHQMEPIPWTNFDVGYGPGTLLRRTGSTLVPCGSATDRVVREFVLTRFTFSAADGGETEFRDLQSEGEPYYNQAHQHTFCTPSTVKDRFSEFVAREGSAATYITNSPVSDGFLSYAATEAAMAGIVSTDSGVLRFRDGRVYEITSGKPTRIRDRHGNFLDLTYAADEVTSTQDSLGRTVTVSYRIPEGTGAEYDEIAYPGYNGAVRRIKIHRKRLAQSFRDPFTQSVSTHDQLFPQAQLNPHTSGITDPTSYDPMVVHSVELPDGRFYQFRYNPYGELERLVLPTGGAIEYRYGRGEGGTTAAGLRSYGHNGVMLYRRVIQRIIKPDGVNTETQSDYSDALLTGGVSVTVSHKNNLGVQAASETHDFYGHPASMPPPGPGYSAWNTGKEYQAEESGLRRTVHTWAQGASVGWYTGDPNGVPPMDPRITQTQTTLLDTSQSALKTFAYDAYNNVTDLYEYDFGVAPPASHTRHTHNDYLTSDPSYTSAAGAHLRSLVTRQTVKDNLNAIVSDSEFLYDQLALTTRSGATGYLDPGRSQRGNATQVRRWQNTPSSQWLVTVTEFDVLGNPVKITNPRGHFRTFEFASPYYGLPSAMVNEASLREEYGYDQPRTWKLISLRDWNSYYTNFAYNDALDRLTSITRPNFSSTAYSYVGNETITTVSQNSCGRGYSRETRLLVDGLGREKRATRHDRPPGYPSNRAIYVDREYQVTGRLWRVSLPHAGVATAWTTYGYDGLNRITSVAMPAGTTTTTYSGNLTTITDPASLQRRTRHDALGRLTQVEENPNALFSQPVLTSLYGYDAADRLTSVTQGGQSRSFGYDTMGWLRWATNPESGSIQYTTYDGNGNLITRVDARGVTTTLAYDALNRMTSASSTGPNTPFRYWIYGPSTDPAGFRGRLKTAVADTVSITEYLAYDALGRVTQSRQTTAGLPYNFSYTYNLAGGLERITYPSGRQVTTCYDPSGQADNVQNKSPWNLSLNVDYLTSAAYALHGAPETLNLASGAVETRTYNSALQPEGVLLAKGGTTLLNLGLCYTCSGGNNGNLQRQTITIPGASWVQNYTYDAYGRLKSATEGAWSQTYVYDPWGNRAVLAGGWVPNAMWTPQTPNQSSVPYTATNRWTGASYDNAGNMTQVGTAAMTYDGENRLRTGGGAEYEYDADGRRVKRTRGGVTTLWVYDAFGKLAAEYSTGAQPSLGRVYLTADHLGSTRVATARDGEVIRRYDYLPFGEQIHAPNGGRTAAMKYTDSLFLDGQRAQFTGKERDAETGLDYFGARYLSAAQGRFTTPDPLMASAKASNPQTWNRYAYALNNPLKFVDPDGLEVPDSCVKDQNCTIVIKLNVVYDATMNRGRGPNQQQRQKWEKEQLAKAQKDYGHSNIKLEATYTPGRYDVGSDGQTPILTGLNPDALNVMVSQGTPTNKAGVSYLDQNGPVSIININDAVGGNWWPAVMNTTAHELGHHFLGHVGTRPNGALDVIGKEYDVDNRLLMQSVGRPQQDFREGVKQKRYAVPLHPEANKPRQ